jgi:hypothetical protein
MIDRIPDMDLRSHMRDLHDRCVLAEKSLERAKALFKSLHPGADPALLEHGHGAISASAPTTEQVEALDGLLSTLTDNARLTAVGLDYDGQRVRRKAGTRDELLGPRLLTLCGELLRSLRRRVSPAVD